MEKIQNYINGDLVSPQSGNYFNNVSPVTGKVYSLIPDSDEHDIDDAVNLPKKHFFHGVNYQKINVMIISCIWQM